jgi:hypothetical protein
MDSRLNLGAIVLLLLSRTHAIVPALRTPILNIFLLRLFLTRLGHLNLLTTTLLRNKTLEPLILHLQLLDFALKHLHLLRHFFRLLLERLLALLLLHAETGGRGRVAAALVLFGCETGGLLHIGGGWQAGLRGLALVARAGLGEMVRLRRVLALESGGAGWHGASGQGIYLAWVRLEFAELEAGRT